MWQFRVPLPNSRHPGRDPPRARALPVECSEGTPRPLRCAVPRGESALTSPWMSHRVACHRPDRHHSAGPRFPRASPFCSSTTRPPVPQSHSAREWPDCRNANGGDPAQRIGGQPSFPFAPLRAVLLSETAASAGQWSKGSSEAARTARNVTDRECRRVRGSDPRLSWNA